MRKALVVLAVLSLGVLAAPAAQAAPFSGHVGPTIIGGLADLNGDGVITSSDSWNDAYGDTEILAGGLDCNNWTVPNDGTQGGGVISPFDDCTLIGVSNVTIAVSNGNFVEANGSPIANGFKLPTVYNALSPTNPSVAASDFTFINVIGGAVDVNHDSLISQIDFQNGIVNGYDILSPFNSGVPASDSGKIDVSGDGSIGSNDDDPSGFFGLAIQDGLVQGAPVTASPLTFAPSSGPVGTVVTLTSTGLTGATKVEFNGTSATFTVDSDTKITTTVPAGATDGPIKVTLAGTAGTQTSVASFDVTTPTPAGCTGTSGNDTLTGTGGADTCVGLAGDDTIMGKAGPDLLKGNQGNDTLKGGRGADVLKGGPGFDVCRGGKGKDTLKGCEA
jgi:Ca2+-binding RTX toxin-like protein